MQRFTLRSHSSTRGFFANYSSVRAWSHNRKLLPHIKRSFSKSTASNSSGGTNKRTPFSRLFKITAGGAVLAIACLNYGVINNVPVSSYTFVYPFIQFIDPEKAHNWAIWALGQPVHVRAALRLIDKSTIDERLETKVWGLTFDNPIGMAAGFDKHAQAVDGLLDLGFGFVEIGSVTPLRQDGNPKPRLFRLSKDKAVINRFGFNSHGHDMVLARLDRRLNQMDRSVGILGINLGKNKTSPSAVDDYSAGIRKLGPFADYIVVNVSSPNTPGLRNLQKKAILQELLKSLVSVRDEVYNKNAEQMKKQKTSEISEISVTSSSSSCEKCLPPKAPLLVKIAPDLTNVERKQIAEVCVDVGIDGLIVSNTTIARPDSLMSVHKNEKGGLSGAPLLKSSTDVLRDMYKLTNGKIPIIGVGGVANGKDAYEKIKAGASLVQIYSSMVYYGPKVVWRIKRQLLAQMEEDGYENISDAIGADHKKSDKAQQ